MLSIADYPKNRPFSKSLPSHHENSAHSGSMTAVLHLPSKVSGLRYPVKGSCVGETALKCPIHGLPGLAWQPAVRVHAYRKLCSPFYAILMLASDAKVAPEQLLLEVAISAQASRTHLTAHLRPSATALAHAA